MISLSGRKWTLPTHNERDILTIQQTHGVSDMLARLLSARGVPISDVPDFLEPTIKRLLPDPSLLLGMDAAVHRTIAAISASENITIYGDYDVDGATSVALLHNYFRHIGISVRYYIPDRLSEGYGVNSEAIRKIHATGTTLIIMVDCGTTSVQEVQLANNLGLNCIILDHHEANIELPDAVAVVNAHRIDQPPVPHTKNLCAAGVVFMFLVALQRAIKNAHSLESLHSKLPDLMTYCDLVALGTVCDVVPLQGLNRAFVRRGLGMMRQNYGIRALIDIAGVKDKISAGHLGFAIGPRINAGGRIGSSYLGVQLLTTRDDIVAKEIAIKLNALNEERQRMEKKTLEEAHAQIEKLDLNQHAAILVADQSWHAGLVGIVASRLKDCYHKASFVAAIDANGLCKGSARSVEGINIGEVIHKAVRCGILSGGGGHAMAGGFSFDLKNMSQFYDFLDAETSDFMKTYIPTLNIDIELLYPTIELLHELELFEPFGMGNPAPKVCFHRVRPVSVRPMGTGHIQCVLRTEAERTFQAVAFRCDGTDLGNALQGGRLMSVVGTLKEDAAKPDNVRVIIEDASVEGYSRDGI
jgi:single-stranded-DNA-specific exonuclease